MGSLTRVCSWWCLLGFALLAPVSLPAGGIERRQSLIRQRERSGPLVVSNNSILRSSPFVEAPSLRKLEIGTPLRVLRGWQNSDGQQWIQVQIISNELIGFNCDISRGWVDI